MRKLIAVLLSICLLGLTALAPACAEGAETGAWVTYTGDQTVIPKTVQKAFDKATEGYTGCKLEPVAYLASQVVAGTNYRLLCRCTTVTQKPVTSYVKVTIFQDLEGNAEITRIRDLGNAEIKLNKTKVTLAVGRTFKVTAKQSGLSGATFTYRSGDRSVATVDKNGKITAKGKGTCTVTVTSVYGQKATIKVKVK